MNPLNTLTFLAALTLFSSLAVANPVAAPAPITAESREALHKKVAAAVAEGQLVARQCQRDCVSCDASGSCYWYCC